MRLVMITALALVLSGCGRSQPTLVGGKPVSHWLSALKDADPAVRRQAVTALGNAGPTVAAVLPALLGALQDPAARVRAEAIVQLVKFGPEASEAVPVLRRMSRHDPSAKVRSYAARALPKIQPDADEAGN